MKHLNLSPLAFLLGLISLSPQLFCQGEAKYRVLSGWALSEQQKPVAAFRASESELTRGTYDPRADALLRAAEKATRDIFIFPDIVFQRAVTYKNGTVDIMLAEWNVEGPSVKGSVILNDTPTYSIYELRINFRKIISREDLSLFLSEILISRRRPLNLEPSLLQVNLPSPLPGITAFLGRFTFSENPMRDCSILGFAAGREWYLTLSVPKTLAYSHYPVQQFVPERFPPLAELARDWTFARIWSELGVTTDSDNGIDLSRSRDAIFINELIRRGLTQDQFVELLVNANPADRRHRAAVVLGNLRYADNGASLDRFFEPALAGYERIGPAAEGAVSELFNEAARKCLPRVETVALRKLKEGVFAQSALTYLGECSASNETITTLEFLRLPESLDQNKEFVLRRIRGRLGNVPR